MRALTEAARELYLLNHPGTPAASWEQLNQRTQIFWALKASATALALANIWENH